jgi:hypothetical protein
MVLVKATELDLPANVYSAAALCDSFLPKAFSRLFLLAKAGQPRY